MSGTSESHWGKQVIETDKHRKNSKNGVKSWRISRETSLIEQMDKRKGNFLFQQLF